MAKSGAGLFGYKGCFQELSRNAHRRGAFRGSDLHQDVSRPNLGKDRNCSNSSEFPSRIWYITYIVVVLRC